MYKDKEAFLAKNVQRFTSIDPHAENYFSWSPYHYGGNNPILNIDPTGRDYWSTNDPDLIRQFFNAMGSGASVADMSGWNHSTDAEFLGRGTFNDETGKFHTSYVSFENGETNVIGISFDTNIQPGLTADGYGYPGAFAYKYDSEDWYAGYCASYWLSGYSPVGYLVDGIAPIDPLNYYDGVTSWDVNMSGRITGAQPNLITGTPPIIGKGGRGKGRGRSRKRQQSSSESQYNQSAEHTKGARSSTKRKHEKGLERKGRDQGNEKGDVRRKRYK